MLRLGALHRIDHIATCALVALKVSQSMHSHLFLAHYLLGKGGYVFGSVGLFVCLSVDNITQKVMNGLG